MSAPVGEARPRRDGVLRFRLLAAFAALSLMPLFASNGIGYLRSRDINDDLVERYLDGIARLQAAHVQDRLVQRSLYLQAIGSANRFLQAAAERGSPGANPGMSAAADPETVRDYLRRKLEESGRFDALALFHTDGRPIASTNEARPLSLPWDDPTGLSLLRSPDGANAPSLFITVPVENVQASVRAQAGAVSRSGDRRLRVAVRVVLENPTPEHVTTRVAMQLPVPKFAPLELDRKAFAALWGVGADDLAGPLPARRGDIYNADGRRSADDRRQPHIPPGESIDRRIENHHQAAMLAGEQHAAET